MSGRRIGLAAGAAYTLGTVARVAWYGGSGLAMRRMLARLEPTLPPRRTPPPEPAGKVPTWPMVLADVADLMRRDLANVAAGHYVLPDDRDPDGLPGLLARTRAFFADVPEVARRRRTEAHQEAAELAAPAGAPRYYRQNFHFQSGGWLTEESARIYDTQVEVLFTGAAAAMRRQALPAISAYLKTHDQRRAVYADLASGTGGLARDVRRSFPKLPVLTVDLSAPYLATGRQRIEKAQPLVADVARLPLADGALDLSTTVYLFHELPPKERPRIAAEIARVTKSGGLAILVDSLQHGDAPDYDALLDMFPQLFHEPYYGHYLDDDISGHFERAGLTLVSTSNAFLSKVMVFRRT